MKEKDPRLEFVERQAAVGAGQVLAEGQFVTADDVHHRDAPREVQGGLERLGEPAQPSPPGDQPVHHHFDRVGVVAVEPDPLSQVHDLPVDAGSAETLPGEVLEQLLVLPFPSSDDGREDLETCSILEFSDLVDDLLGCLARNHAWLVAGGWWLVAGGWWLVAGGWWLVAGEW